MWSKHRLQRPSEIVLHSLHSVRVSFLFFGACLVDPWRFCLFVAFLGDSRGGWYAKSFRMGKSQKACVWCHTVAASAEISCLERSETPETPRTIAGPSERFKNKWAAGTAAFCWNERWSKVQPRGIKSCRADLLFSFEKRITRSTSICDSSSRSYCKPLALLCSYSNRWCLLRESSACCFAGGNGNTPA